MINEYDANPKENYINHIFNHFETFFSFETTRRYGILDENKTDGFH